MAQASNTHTILELAQMHTNTHPANHTGHTHTHHSNGTRFKHTHDPRSGTKYTLTHTLQTAQDTETSTHTRSAKGTGYTYTHTHPASGTGFRHTQP